MTVVGALVPVPSNAPCCRRSLFVHAPWCCNLKDHRLFTVDQRWWAAELAWGLPFRRSRRPTLCLQSKGTGVNAVISHKRLPRGVLCKSAKTEGISWEQQFDLPEEAHKKRGIGTLTRLHCEVFSCLSHVPTLSVLLGANLIPRYLHIQT
jgi:hypothetical protein